MTQSHDSFDDSTRFFDIDEIISRVFFREQSASDDDSDVNEIKKRASSCSSVKYFSSRQIFEKLTTFCIIALNKSAISLRVDEKNDRNDCVTSRNSELINDDDSENDDEA
jgi:hypothetical protein